MPNEYKLIIANKNYSSWSLRAWLFLRKSGISFEEIRIPMFTASWQEHIARYSPAGRVPVLLHDEDLAEWLDAARTETERIEFIDELVPAAESMLTLG